MRVRLEEILTCALRNHHDGMAAREDPLFERSQETAAAVETEWHFRDEGKVDVLARYGGAGGNSPRCVPLV